MGIKRMGMEEEGVLEAETITTKETVMVMMATITADREAMPTATIVVQITRLIPTHTRFLKMGMSHLIEPSALGYYNCTGSLYSLGRKQHLVRLLFYSSVVLGIHIPAYLFRALFSVKIFDLQK